jgi:hypothetical protein
MMGLEIVPDNLDVVELRRVLAMIWCDCRGPTAATKNLFIPRVDATSPMPLSFEAILHSADLCLRDLLHANG